VAVHIGNCHFGKIEFQVETDLSDPVRCNCSFCECRGTLLQKVEAGQFALISGDNVLSSYGSRDFSDHLFCKNCGVHVFTRSTRNDEFAVIVNIACLRGVNLQTIRPRVFDGARLL
jgi:hypothetical protein